MPERQVKSKARVADHGEVFTAEREVNAMLDLVKPETERIDSRFLEPACGDGNFLAEILRRKLVAAERMSHHTRLNRKTLNRTVLKTIDKGLYEKNAFIAVTSVYGVDILEDNVQECRARLYDIWNRAYTAVCGDECRDDVRDAVRYVLEKNILCGNALSLKQVDETGQDTKMPIIFSEWVFAGVNSVKRRIYRLDMLMQDEKNDAADEQISLFDEDLAYKAEWMVDPETGIRMPKPIREYMPVYYWNVQTVE